MDKLINLKFSGKIAKTLVKRHGAVSFFSDETENKVNDRFDDNEQYSGKYILIEMIIVGVKNFDPFDIKELCDSFDCSLQEVENYLDNKLIDNCYPLKMSSQYVNFHISNLQKKMNNASGKEKERIKLTLQRFNDWKNKLRIVIKKD